MAKDPAALFYIATWLSSTAEMDSDVRGWYLNLILHQFDKADLPNDMEKLAVLAGVKFSEFDRFKQMFEQMLKHKFEVNDKGRLENVYAKTIIVAREIFKEKRSKSGNIGYVVKLAYTIKGYNSKAIEWLKDRLYTYSDEQIEEAKNKHVLEHLLKLYINEDVNKDAIDSNIIKVEKIDFDVFWGLYDKKVGDKEKLIKKWDNLTLEVQQQILDYIPKYKQAQPEKKYRKNPDTFFNQKSWNDELIVANNQPISKLEQNLASYHEANKMIDELYKNEP